MTRNLASGNPAATDDQISEAMRLQKRMVDLSHELMLDEITLASISFGVIREADRAADSIERIGRLVNAVESALREHGKR